MSLWRWAPTWWPSLFQILSLLARWPRAESRWALGLSDCHTGWPSCPCLPETVLVLKLEVPHPWILGKNRGGWHLLVTDAGIYNEVLITKTWRGLAWPGSWSWLHRLLVFWPWPCSLWNLVYAFSKCVIGLDLAGVSEVVSGYHFLQLGSKCHWPSE